VTFGLFAPTIACASDEVEGVTAVASRVSSDYVRAKLPDGSFQAESYAFGEGGKWGGNLADATIDELHFMDVAKVIAVPLAGQNYTPSKDPKATKLLIMLYWGMTNAPEHASESAAYQRLYDISNAMKGPRSPGRSDSSGKPSFASSSAMEAALQMVKLENLQRDRVNKQNADMLGYDSWWEATNHFKNVGFGLDFERQDMINEFEQNRYFVVLMAYDFQLMWKQKRHKLLWETRFSIDEHHNAFDKALPAMANYASKYFGQDSEGLLRTRVPEGRVDVGDLRSLGEIDAPQK